MAYKFNWDGLRDLEFGNYVSLLIAKEEDFIGSVRVGDLCFELNLRYYGPGEMCLDYDLFEGGVDDGYGYSEDGYPYTHEGGSGFDFDLDLVLKWTYEDFKKAVEEELTAYIDPIPRLAEKANQELHIW